jgi:hypothetical protein
MDHMVANTAACREGPLDESKSLFLVAAVPTGFLNLQEWCRPLTRRGRWIKLTVLIIFVNTASVWYCTLFTFATVMAVILGSTDLSFGRLVSTLNCPTLVQA